MDNVININHTKENTLEFEMVIEGATTNEVDCNFVIIAKGMELRFPAELSEGNHWTVTLPEMQFLERTAYQCYTEVVAEGQYFKPMKGNVNVVGTAQIFTSSPKNKTIESDVKKAKVVKEQEKKRETKRRQESWRQSEKPIDQIAKELMEQEKFEKTNIDKKVDERRAAKDVKEDKVVAPEKPIDPEREAKIKAIVEQNRKEKEEKAKKLKEAQEAAKAAAAEKPAVKKVKESAAPKKKTAKKTAVKKEAEVTENETDAKVRAILKESGFESKKKKKRKVTFVKTKPLH